MQMTKLAQTFSYLSSFYQKDSQFFNCIDKIIEHLTARHVQATDVIFMSNGGFDNIVNKYTK